MTDYSLGVRPGTPPDKNSSRISWWPAHRAPSSVMRVADKIWPDRDARVTWWFGCASVSQNPEGFPTFMHPTRVAKVGHYWFGLSFMRPGGTYHITDARDIILPQDEDITEETLSLSENVEPAARTGY